jgi:hypothetical protein
MKRIVNVEPSLEIRIQDIIKTKRYADFQHFATIAFENQIAWETSSSSHIEQSQTLTIDAQKKYAEGLELLTKPLQVKHPIELPQPENTSSILWGQFYRFLPCKFGVRVLSYLCKDNLADVRDFTTTATDLAVVLRGQLAKLDRAGHREFGDRISASFPTKDEKSRKRFASQYMLSVRTGTMKIIGMLPDMKLINIKINGESDIKVGLTKQGWSFARLRNPVIDDNTSNPLSKDEVKFLLDHIADNMPEELEHMICALRTINDDRHSSDELNDALKRYYKNRQHDLEWSDAVISTMRSGLLGRLNELGLINRKKRGKNVSYHITNEGRRYMEGVKYA